MNKIISKIVLSLKSALGTCLSPWQIMTLWGFMLGIAVSSQAQTHGGHSNQEGAFVRQSISTLKTEKKPSLVPNLEKQKDPKNLFKKPDFTTTDFIKKSLQGGGWGSSGGGSGIACFSDESAANQAEEFISKNQVLPVSLMNQISEVTTLDYWEWRQKKPFELFQSSAQDVDGLIYEVYKRMSRLVPLYIFRLQQAGEMIELKNWTQQEQVTRIYDANPEGVLPKNCKQIQLVARYAKDSYNDKSGPSKKIPQVRVEVNKALFEKLDLVNQATLILHEQIYLLGQMTGMKSSDQIRSIVMTFFNQKIDHISAIGKDRYYLRLRLVQYFGDYLNYFGDELKFKAEPYSSESRFNSFYQLINLLRNKKGLCQKGQLPAEEMIPWRKDLKEHKCDDYVMNPDLVAKSSTDEMAYVYIANYVLDLSAGVLNSEDVLTPFQDEQFVRHSQKVFELSCNIIINNRHQIDLGDLISKAVQYCQEARSRLGPTGKDQN